MKNSHLRSVHQLTSCFQTFISFRVQGFDSLELPGRLTLQARRRRHQLHSCAFLIPNNWRKQSSVVGGLSPKKSNFENVL